MPLTIEQALAQLDSFLADSVSHPDFVRHRERYRSDAALVLEHERDGRVLEIGSAPCHASGLMKLIGIDVLGIDLDPQRCQALIDQYELSVTRCDIEREALPLADASVPLVLFAETLEHLRVDPLFVLSEINRVLAPGGTLLLTTPNLYSAQNIVRFIAGRGINDAYSEFSKLRRLGHMGHVREYTPAEVQRVLRESGFAIEAREFKHYYFPGTRRGRVARLTFAILPKRFRTYQIVVARKVDASPGLSPLY